MLRHPAALGLASLVVIAWSSATSAQSAVADLVKRLDLVPYRVGTTIPHFGGVTLDAHPLALSDLRGKVALLNFWASWCVDCRSEMPVLQGLHRELAARGLAVIGINAREEKHVVARYAAELALTFPIVLDPAGKNTSQYGVVGIPTTVLVGRDGRAVGFAVGPRDWGSRPARELIERLLAEPALRP